MKKIFAYILVGMLMLSAPKIARAENLIQIQAESNDPYFDLATFYTGAATDRLYLCEVSAHEIYIISADGTLTKTSSIDAMEDADDAQRYRSVLALVSDGNQAYEVAMHVHQSEDGYAFEGAGLYAMGENEAGAQVCALDLSDAIVDGDYGKDTLNCASALMHDGYLHLLFDENEGGGWAAWGGSDESQCHQRLISIELSTGKKTLHQTTGLMQIVAAEGAQLLCARADEGETGTTMIVFDIATGEARDANRLSGSVDRPRNIVFDRARNRAFYCVMNQIWGMEQIGQEPKLIALLSARQLDGLYCLNENTLCAYDSKTGYVFPLDWNAKIESLKLNATGGSASLDEYARLHPELELNYLDNLDARELVDTVLTQSDAVDILGLSSDEAVFTDLKSRGYLMPITDEALVDFVHTLHPDIQNFLCVDGVPCAIPTGVDFLPMFGVNRALWQQLNLGEIPASWPEMIDFIERWIAGGSQVPLINAQDGAAARHDFMWRLINDYEAYRASQGNMGYDTETFRTLAARLDGLRWDALSFDAGAQDGALFSSSVFPSLEVRHPVYKMFSLSIEAGGEPCVTARLYLSAINPYTRHGEIALDYLRYAVKNIAPHRRLALCPNENEPPRMENLDAIIADGRENIARLEAQIAAAESEADRQELNWQKEEAERSLQQTMENPWAIDPAEIADFRACSQRISLENADGLDSSTRSVIQDYGSRMASGEIGVEEFISEADRRITMQIQENAR